MEIGRYHWMYPGSKNHQYRPVPTLGDRANPLSSPGKYSLGVHSHSNSTVIFNMICDSSFGLVLFSVLLDAFICSQGLGWKWPFKNCFHHLFLSSSPFHPIFPLFLLPPPCFLFPLISSSQREQGTMRCALGLSMKCLIFEPPMGWGSHTCLSWVQELSWDIWGAWALRVLSVAPNISLATWLSSPLIY